MENSKESIVKSSLTIRTFITRRMSELKMTPSDVIIDANNMGAKIDNASFSRFIKHGNVKGSLSEKSIVWLCIRWGIPLQLIVGQIHVDKGKLKSKLPTYNEKKALENLKKIFQ